MAIIIDSRFIITYDSKMFPGSGLIFNHVNIVQFLIPFSILIRHLNNTFSVNYMIIGDIKPIQLSTVREE